MVSRLILSLREAVDKGLVLCWDENHLSVDIWNDSSREMTDLRFRSSRTMRGMTEGTVA